MKYTLKQRFLSWLDSYDIYDENGNVAFSVEGKLALDMVKGGIRLECIYTFMRLIDHQDIPVGIFDFFQLIKLAAEIDRPLQILQAQEFNTIEEPSQEQEPGFVGKAWDKTQEFSGSVCATIKEKPGESLAIAGLGYVGIKFIGWVAGKLCGGKKD